MRRVSFVNIMKFIIRFVDPKDQHIKKLDIEEASN